MIEKSIYTIAEVAEIFEVNESKIRYYVNHFEINVPKKANKFAFSKKHVNKIRKVLELTDEKGFKLDAVKRNLRKKEEKTEHLNQILDKLIHVRSILHSINTRIN